MSLVGGLLVVLIIADAIALTFALAEAYLLYRRGGKVLRQIALRDVCLAAEVVSALVSWFTFRHPAAFVIVRLVGRVIENFGFIRFMTFLIGLRAVEEQAVLAQEEDAVVGNPLTEEVK